VSHGSRRAGILTACLGGLVVVQAMKVEGQLTESERLRERVAFEGPRTTPSGLEAAADVTHEERDGKQWPYATIAIRAPAEGDVPVYASVRYAAWFDVRVCWDEGDRLWIDSTDTGVDVIARTPDGWQRHRWMPGFDRKTIRDVESGQPVPVVNWAPPPRLERLQSS
jgi:hypothetical protein